MRKTRKKSSALTGVYPALAGVTLCQDKVTKKIPPPSHIPTLRLTITHPHKKTNNQFFYYFSEAKQFPYVQQRN
jgi:hypothetical protein